MFFSNYSLFFLNFCRLLIIHCCHSLFHWHINCVIHYSGVFRPNYSLFTFYLYSLFIIHYSASTPDTARNNILFSRSLKVNFFLKTASVDVSCFLFSRGSCSGCFQAISTSLKGSSFCRFGGVFYKPKTMVKFVENFKC